MSSPAPTDIGLLDGGDGFDIIDFRNIGPVTVGMIQNAAGKYVLGAYVGSQKFEIANVERVLLGTGNDFVSMPSESGGIEIRLGGGDDYIPPPRVTACSQRKATIGFFSLEDMVALH